MAKAKGIRAGRAFVEIFGDDSKLQRTLGRIKGRLRAFGASVQKIGLRTAGLGAAITAPLLLAAKQFANVGDNLNKMSIRTGIAAEDLSQLGFAAEQSGSSLDELAAATLRMNRRLGRITAGQASKTQEEALESLGLSAERLQQLSPEERLFAIADAMAGMSDQAEAAGLAQRAFGTQVDKILPLLLQGSDGIRALKQEAKDLGLTLSTEDAQAAADLTDAMNRVVSVVKRAAVAVGSALAPILEKTADLILSVAKPVREWIDANRGLVQTVLLVGAAVTGLGVAAIVLGTAFTGLAAAVGIAGTALSVIGGILGAIFSPIGIIIAGVVALGAILVQTTGAGKQALAGLSGFFDELAADAKQAFGAIGAALAAGDIQAAFAVLKAFLALRWERVKQLFFEGLGAIKKAFLRAWASIKTVFAETMAGVVSIWKRTQQSIAEALTPTLARLFGAEERDIRLTLEANRDELNRELAAIGGDLSAEKRAIDERLQKQLAAAGDDVAARQAALDEARKAFDEAKEKAEKAPSAGGGGALLGLGAGVASAVEIAKQQRKQDEAAAAGESFIRNRQLTAATDVGSRAGMERILQSIQGVRQRDAEVDELKSMNQKQARVIDLLRDQLREIKKKPKLAEI